VVVVRALFDARVIVDRAFAAERETARTRMKATRCVRRVTGVFGASGV